MGYLSVADRRGRCIISLQVDRQDTFFQRRAPEFFFAMPSQVGKGPKKAKKEITFALASDPVLQVRESQWLTDE